MTYAKPRSRLAPNHASGMLVMTIIYAGLAATVVFPLLAVLVQAFFHGPGVNVENLRNVFTSPLIVRAIYNTIAISVMAVVLAAFLGVSLAWLNARTDMPFKRYFEPLNMIPFYLSSVVGALSWQVVAAPRSGMLNTLLAPITGGAVFNIYSIWGVALVLGIFYTPYIYLFTLGSLKSMDASLEEAARTSGASILQTALRITIPLSAPAITSSCMLVFMTAAGIFGVPLLLGTPGRVHTLSTLIYRYVSDYPTDYGTAAILSAALFIFVVILTILQMRILRGRHFTTVTGKGYKPRLINLGMLGWFAVGLNGLYLLLVLGPFVALLIVSFADAWTGTIDFSRFTWMNYYRVLFVDETAQRGFFNSMFIAPVGATISVFICLIMALVVRRTRLPGREGVVWLTLLPLTVPGIVLGLGFLIAYLQSPLYGTLWIIMIAYIVNFLPTGFRNLESQVLAVSTELDESARMSGANWRQAMVKIMLPLVAPGMVATWLLMFVAFIREVSASMMLFTYGTETLSIALIRLMDYEAYGVSSAFGIMQTVFLLGCVAIIRTLSNIWEDRRSRI
ncbi:ABC transporter permease [Pseudochelatococcus sp. B33]